MNDRSISLATFLTVFTTFGLFFFITLLIFHTVPEETRTPVFSLVATISTAWGAIIGYYFGSSSGSAKKTELMSQPTDKKEQ
jgi:membrane protein YqaA with SNARE-associated domain